MWAWPSTSNENPTGRAHAPRDDQVNVNRLMVAMGYAEVYRGARCQVSCRELEDAEAKARRDRVGMWMQGASYESPRDFRRRMRLSGN